METTKHQDKDVALQACEFWAAIAQTRSAAPTMKPFLKEFVRDALIVCLACYILHFSLASILTVTSCVICFALVFCSTFSLVPLLLSKMVYSKEELVDLAEMSKDDAHIADKDSDIAPTFAHGRTKGSGGAKHDRKIESELAAVEGSTNGVSFPVLLLARLFYQVPLYDLLSREFVRPHITALSHSI